MEQWGGKSAFYELFMSSQVVKIKWYMYTQQWACLMQQTALGVFDGKQRMDTLMSYTEPSVKCQFQSNTPIVWGWSVGPIMKYTLFCTFLFHYSYFSFFTIYMLLCCVTLHNFFYFFLFFCTVHWADLIRLHFTSNYTLYKLLCDK